MKTVPDSEKVHTFSKPFSIQTLWSPTCIIRWAMIYSMIQAGPTRTSSWAGRTMLQLHLWSGPHLNHKLMAPSTPYVGPTSRRQMMCSAVRNASCAQLCSRGKPCICSRMANSKHDIRRATGAQHKRSGSCKWAHYEYITPKWSFFVVYWHNSRICPLCNAVTSLVLLDGMGWVGGWGVSTSFSRSDQGYI